MDNDVLNQRISELGREIFELADGARPRLYQSSWWLERGTQVLDYDEQVRTRAFQFVDCLPALQTNADIARHLNEYLDPRAVDLPKAFRAATAPGPLQGFRAELIGKLARFGATVMAGRFITGFDVPSVAKTLERLRRDGLGFTLDVLGEFTTSDAQADRYAAVYHDLIDRVAPLVASWKPDPLLDFDEHGSMPRLNLSIKLTGLDPHFDGIDPERAIARVCARLKPLLLHAREAGAFVNIDMESFKHHDLTLELFQRVLMEPAFRDWTDVGIVLQAYLRKSERSLGKMLDFAKRRGTRFAIRLVKGAYWDAETAAAVRNHHTPPVWTQKWETDACYERMVGTMLRNTALIRPAFASHNVRSLAVIGATAESLGLSPHAYEVQMLYGMGDPLKTAMANLGRCVRVYCPYGDLMPGMGYLIRRLLENTSNEGFLKQGFGDRGTYARLLADPAQARPASAPLVERYYRNTNPEEPMGTFKNATNTSFTTGEAREKMIGAIDYVRKDFGRMYSLVIDGKHVATGEQFTSHNPSNPGEPIGKVALATTADADRAVAAAYKAFAAWQYAPATMRGSLLRALADKMEDRRFELAATIILEVGKPWREADADVTEAIDHARYYAEQIERIEHSPRLRNVPGEANMMTYAPKGVCAVISPWAFPLAILTGMTTAAIAAGNTVVIKPARQASVIAAKLVEMVHDVGFPAGVVNYLPGDGAVVGRHLIEHGEVHVVAFTGSEKVGTEVIQAGAKIRPAQAFIKKMIVEMGGKNAIIVDDDADIDGAIQAIIESAFSYAGQKCSSCSRVIVLDGVFNALAERLAEAVKSLTIGPADVPSSNVGPVIDDDARRRIQEYIDLGKKEGRVFVEGSLSGDDAGGYFVAPTILTGINNSSRLAQEEIFGPVVVLFRAKDFDEALDIANSTRYALTGGLFSRSPMNIERARNEFAVGNLYINRRITGSQVDAQPFGGFKLSGTGVKAGSPDYLLHFMDARCITENTTRSGLVPTDKRTNAS
jgi:RHH-type transcriptional regulator, proline utilization regulon repressor / proline dehydrogenase / delta 1-pyrroline-5-carboxylate dehydrogenase